MKQATEYAVSDLFYYNAFKARDRIIEISYSEHDEHGLPIEI